MLICHKYRFIFIKTLKTAGTSIEVELSRKMSDFDVVTPIIPPEPEHVPRNYVTVGPNNRRVQFFNHMPALLVRQLIGKDKFDRYFKFCVEREPVDKCISDYSMRKNSPTHNRNQMELTSENYVNAGRFPVDADKYTDESGTLIVDKILKYENLQAELSDLVTSLGLAFERINSRAKSGFRTNVSVSKDQRLKIYDAFSASNRFTGYKFTQ